MIARIGGAAVLACAVASGSAIAAGPPLDLDAVAGVYKSRFENGDVQGRSFPSEDILEILKLSPTAAYFKSHTEFFNGHLCDIFGVADVHDDALVYVDRSDTVAPDGQRCVLTMRVTASTIRFEDASGACKSYCGVRGSLDGNEVDRTKRRTIRYMKLLRDSADFHHAVDEHDRAAVR